MRKRACDFCGERHVFLQCERCSRLPDARQAPGMDSTVLAQFATPPEPAAQRVSPEDWQRLGEMQDTAREVGERLAEVRERLGLEPDEAEREARAFLGTHYGRGHTTDVQYLATLLRAAEARGRERGLEDGIDACEREAGSLPVDWRARAEEAESRLEYAQWREQYEAAVAYKARAEEAERLLAEAREVLRSLDRGPCIWCSLGGSEGHTPDCRLAGVLGDF